MADNSAFCCGYIPNLQASTISLEAFVVIDPSAVVTRVVRFPNAVDVAATPVLGSSTVTSNAVTSAAIDVMELPCEIVVVHLRQMMALALARDV